VQVGDIIKFTESRYQGIILGFTEYGGVTIYVMGQDVKFKNPTSVGMKMLKRNAVVVSESR
tara:strand:- start:1203 stop:1385 length:183 start_codon:yes stop_codon:yes gene_type:complete